MTLILSLSYGPSPPAASAAGNALPRRPRWQPRILKLHHGLIPQALKASTPIEALAGVDERVTFHNEENGFCVLRVKARGQRDLTTVFGHAAMVSAGAFVQASVTLDQRPH